MVPKQTLPSGADLAFFKGGVDDTNWPSNYTKFILTYFLFVPKHGDLGRIKAGWLLKVFQTHVFLYIF